MTQTDKPTTKQSATPPPIQQAPSKAPRPNQPPKKNGFGSKDIRNWLFWILAFLIGFPLLLTVLDPPSRYEEIPLSQAVQEIGTDNVTRVDVEAEDLTLTYTDESKKTSRLEFGTSLGDTLANAQVNPGSTVIDVKDLSWQSMLRELMIALIPIGVLVLVVIYFLRSARGAQGDVFSFGRSKAKLFDKGKQSVKFKDVAGVDEAKNELEEIVDFLKHPDKYKKIGARTPKGVLLVGPAGVGKTLLARAVAGEAEAPFYSMAGSEFMEMLVGVGASRVRDLFATAKKNAPAIIFIDEIDAIGRQRGSGFASGAHDEREQTLNQILVEMDGFTPNDNVIVLAATNRGDLLDSALLRPGRFDRRVTLEVPDLAGREEILKIHAGNKPFAKDVKWTKVAKRTVGFSGADLENMLNEAAIQAAKAGNKQITVADIEEAATKVKLGPEKRRLQSEYELKMTAFHEAGHALVSFYMPHVDPVHRISIISRGRALGYTMVHPVRDRVQETKVELEEQMAMLLGGRAAEQLIFNEYTGGAASDLERATQIARTMVMTFGMDDDLGLVYYGKPNENSYERQPISEAMQSKIDAAVNKAIKQAYDQAYKILKTKKDKLTLVAETLLDVETIEGEDFETMLGEPRPKHPHGDKLVNQKVKKSDTDIKPSKTGKKTAFKK